MRESHHIFKGESIPSVNARLASLPGKTVFRKYFLSSADQALLLPPMDGAVSVVVQPPLDGSSVAVWEWKVDGAAEVEYSEGVTLARETDGCAHIWCAGLTSARPDSEGQTAEILERYGDFLAARGLNLPENCVRTWFYVNDIDNNYAGMVKARREYFEAIGLTSRTHYIASTGICGAPARGGIVQMDAYALSGKFTQRYLYAPTHLNPTYEYGVTFERGVCVSTCGAPKVIISGTASINNRGEVVHVGDVLSQTRRMIENVEVLLAEGGTSWNDIKQAVFYLRNAEDYKKVAPLVAERCSFPYVVVLAPVCRPDWLIEMECLAFS